MITRPAPILYFLALAVVMFLAGWLFGNGRCPKIDKRATEDSIASRVRLYVEADMRRAARIHILDSIKNLPTPQEYEDRILPYVRSLSLERQLERAEQDPR